MLGEDTGKEALPSRPPHNSLRDYISHILFNKRRLGTRLDQDHNQDVFHITCPNLMLTSLL